MSSAGNWLSLSRKILASRLGSLDLPYKMTYVVTKSCHSRCQNCRIWDSEVKDELSLSEIERIAKGAGFLSWIDFTGGEPTDRADFAEVARVFVEACPRLQLLHFPTNGLVPGRIEQMTRSIRAVFSGRMVVTVSIDGPPETNSQIRGIPTGFDRSIDTLRRLRAIKGVETFVGMTLYASNYHLIDATVSAIAAHVPGFEHKDLHINLGHTSGHHYENEDCLQPAGPRLADAIKAFQSKRGWPRAPFDVLESLYHRGLLQYLNSGKTPMSCASLLSSFYLSEKGMVYPCTIWNQPLGNVRDVDYDLRRILAQPNTAEARERVREGACPNCWTPCEAYQSIAASAGKI